MVRLFWNFKNRPVNKMALGIFLVMLQGALPMIRGLIYGYILSEQEGPATKIVYAD